MSVLVSDNFNRANSGSLGAAWTNKRASPAITSNAVSSGTAADENLAYRNDTVMPNDHWAQATAVASGAYTQCVGIRLQTAADRSGYYGGCDQLNNGDILRRVWKFVVAALTVIGTEAVSIALNDVIYAEVQGTTVLLKVNGTPSSATGTAADYASGRSGLGVSDAAGGVALLDDWSAGDFTVSGNDLSVLVGEPTLGGSIF